MNKLMLLSVASAFAIAACSHMPMASTNGASHSTVAAAGEQYCFKRNLVQSDGKLYCNWVTDRNDACNARSDTALDVGRYSDPAPAGRCETGEYLMKVSPKA